MFLSEMALSSGNRFFQVFVDKVDGKACPHGKVTSLNGLDPCRGGGAETGLVEIIDYVPFHLELIDVVGSMEWDSQWLVDCGLQSNVPEAGDGVTTPLDDDVVVLYDANMLGIKPGFEAVITKLTDGE